ncbi:uncharacterized protein KIAA1143 [Aethina tumida]|uniref:uncharacterized protein KIAA1143 n=1 Tax=Aethina tumida TaxID=116153 RepID=UPI0021473516|nr:uncharacterized protein KIAA1143 [Aethina tumida]
MSKRNIAYVKPAEPSFLRKLKEQAGYVEGPTVDTKREDLGPVRDEDLEDGADELPTVVVLNEGDLTAEQAAQEKIRQEKEAEEKPADLNCPIVFKAPKKKQTDPNQPSKRPSDSGDKKSKKQKKNTKLLSFDADEEDQ